MFNRLLLPSYLRAATPHHYLPCRAARPSEQNLDLSIISLAAATRSHFKFTRHLTICLAHNFAPLTFPVPVVPAIARLSPMMMNIEQNSALREELANKWSPTYFWPQLPGLFVSYF